MESSTGSGASEVEDLVGDLGPANHIFRQMLRAHKASFIERLEKMAMDDDSLDPSDTSVGAALEAVIKFIATKSARDVEALSLFSLSDFGMSKAGIYNIAYYVTQLHEARHKAATATPGSVSSTYSDSSQVSNGNSNGNNNSARRYSWGSKLRDGSSGHPVPRTIGGSSSAAISLSMGGSTDYENELYEEDFEAAEEEIPDEELGAGAYRNGGDNDYDDYTGQTDSSMRSSTLIIDGEVAGGYAQGRGGMAGIPKPLVSQSVERGIGSQGRSSSSSGAQRDLYGPGGAATSLSRPATTASVSMPVSVPHPSSSSTSSSANAPGAAVHMTRASSVQDSKAKDKTWIAKGNWRIGEKIGSGSFGEVFQGLNGYGKLFAVKRLALAGGKMADLENLVSEIELMRSLSHPNIVEYIGTKVDVKTGFVYIFQEWVPGGSVASMLKKFGPFQVGVVHAYTQQILLGLEYLHAHGIVHRDIKGGNILVDDAGRVKLADFGASTKVMFDETQETQTIKGTPYFMAPEVLSQSKYGRKGDIWAVGCTVIQMLTGEPPWKSNNLQSIIQLHLLLSNRPEGPPPVDRPIPEILHDFLVTIFKTDPRNRPTASELLQHPFLSDDFLEDSMGGTLGPSGSMFNNKPYTDEGASGSGGSTRDLLRLKAGEDANNSSANLKAKLEMAAGSGRPPKNYEDTMQYIDAQIASRASGKAPQGSASGAGDTGMRIAVPPPGRPSSSGTGHPSPAGSPPITPRNHEFDPRQRASRLANAGGTRYNSGGDYNHDTQDSMNYSESESRSPITKGPESIRARYVCSCIHPNEKRSFDVDQFILYLL
jgi:serine/threonine protein kinase